MNQRAQCCPRCNRIDAIKRINQFDAYACGFCLIWLEPACPADCVICTTRPERPLRHMVNWTDPFNTGNPGVVEVRTRASLSWLQLLGFTACEITTPNCEHVPRWMRTERILPRVTALHRIGLVTTKGGKWTQVPMTLVGESEPMSLEGMLARARYRNDVAGFFK